MLFLEVMIVEGLISALKALPDDNKNKLIKQFLDILGDSQIHQITGILDSVSNIQQDADRSREHTLTRVETFASQATRLEKKDVNDNYSPIVNCGQIIGVDFSGLGGEITKYHRAIVWDVSPQSETLVVIPLKSKKPTTVQTGVAFSIGRITFSNHDNAQYPVESIAVLNQITTISRKRIDKYRQSLPNPRTGKDVVFITKEQQTRVEDGLRVLCLYENTLYDEILNSHVDTLPELRQYDIQVDHLFRPFKKVSYSKHKVVYTVGTDPREFELIRNQTTIDPSYRATLLNDWVTATGNTQSDQTSKQKRAYRRIQNKIVSTDSSNTGAM